jgi:hypothetical protein
VESSEFDARRSDLREAAETLEQALTEACASRPAHEADTGELIRVEEMLALASDAARRAISIRRKARQVGEPGLESDLGIDQRTSTTHRLFDDGRGVSWDVWAVYPEGRPSQHSALPGTFQSGWLVFESSAEKRRLSPIPSGWLTLPLNELEQLCEQASAASRPARRQPAREDEDTPRGE